MKKIVLSLILSVISYSSYSNPDLSIKVSNASLEKQNDSLTIVFNLYVSDLNGNNKLYLSPIIKNTGGAKYLDPVLIMGRKMKIIEERKGGLSKDIFVGSPGKNISYKSVIPYETWMSNIELSLMPTLSGCCKSEILDNITLIKEKVLEDTLCVEEEEVIVGDVEEVFTDLDKLDQEYAFLSEYKFYDSKAYTREGALIVKFIKNEFVINPDFLENKQVLDKINEALSFIEKDPNAKLKKIVIAGFTSPEGTYAQNQKLSEKRAIALKNLIQTTHKNIEPFIEIIEGGEDWTGLRELIVKSDMSEKESILNIIDNVPIFSGREYQLMRLNRGDSYRYMEKHFFPVLRNVGFIRVYYQRSGGSDSLVKN